MKSLSNDLKNEYFREMYAWRKTHHICVKCGQRDAIKGRARCIMCAEKGRERDAKRHAMEKLEYRTEEKYISLCRINKLYDLRVAFGVCTDCGKRNALSGYTKCNECMIKRRRKSEEKRRKAGVFPRDSYSNLCAICNKKTPLNGQKLCKECYEKSLQSLAKANAARDKENHIWRNKNRITFKRYEEKTNKVLMEAGDADGN